MRALFQLVVLATFFVASNAAHAQDKPRIIAVNYPLQYFAERLLGDFAEVIYPISEGVDPSFWRPSIADISTIQSADLVLLNGAGFATWTSKVSLPRSKLVDTSRGLEDRFIATESITHSHGGGGEHSHEGVASYTWLDLSLATAQAEAIADAIKMRGLADAEAVDERVAALVEELKALDASSRETLANTNDTVFIATHPRYQYFARAYGLTILSLEWDAGAMPSEDELAELETLTNESGATVLIWEAAPPAPAREAVASLGLKDLVFVPLAAAPVSSQPFPDLFSDAVNALAVAAKAAGQN